MERSRAFYDADKELEYAFPTNYRTERNTHEILCGICAGAVFVNKLIRDDVQAAIDKTGENPFACPGCLAEYAEMQHGAR